MKPINRYRLILFAVSILLSPSLFAQVVSLQDSTGLPGDNFSLQGALEMFKKAGSPEEFEKLVNTEDNRVNNLDLNGDGETDYIKVVNRSEGDAQAFILQAAVSESENQDIAVIELEKTGAANAVLQIVGDEDIYGEETIVEPVDEGRDAKAQQPAAHVTVNVWAWPSVKYIYSPAYVGWVSPWRWAFRPVWWHPWSPLRVHAFYPFHAPYHHRYVIVHQHRTVYAHRVYRPIRTTSVLVHNRNQTSVNHYRASRTTKTVAVTNNNRNVKVTRKTTAVKGAGRGRAAKTTTKVRKR